MDRNARNVLLAVFAAAAVLGLGAAVLWALRAPRPAEYAVDLAPAAPLASSTGAADAGAGPARAVELAAEEPVVYGALDTTVIFPLEVELTLERAASTPQAEGAPPLGAGATASLAGSVVDGRGAGVRAQLRFVAGPNAGRLLTSDALGRFGASGLHPGISIVSIAGAGIVGAEREVRLRPQRETQLNVGFGRPARVFADVVDKDGQPIAGALVRLDGQVRESGEDGGVEFAAVAPGEVVVIVSKPGFAAVRQSLNIPGAATIERGRLKFRLDPGASLQVSITDALNSGVQATLFLLPDSLDGERTFPWHAVNPVRIWPGGTALVEDLPATRVSLRLFHAGARAKPARRSIELQSGARTTVEFGLEPAPVVAGTVTDGGAPASGALVRLEAPNRAEAMLSVFGETNFLLLESDVLPDLPPALQEALANAQGEYQLSANEEVAAVRYLTATSRDGKRVAHAVLRRGDVRADLVLQPVADGRGELVIQMDGRFQPLPVEARVDGVPRDPFVLPPGRDLRIAGLPEGSWQVTVRWNEDVLARSVPLEIRGEATLHVALPEGAIVGQDEETRRRAGKR
ncbi:MAG: carboxypeptidase regulatory-like domain-containing protein [Planctomycetes bacterium]|nr:carboxypeptidase regulatory-like domain-containing protein [Planctomycetota bacterium]